MLTILIALTTTSHATTFAVPLDYPSLVDAVVASNADTTQPNEIVIASGTYSFVGGLGVTHDVTIKPDGSGPVVFQRGYGNAAFFLPDATSLTIEDIDFTAYNARIVDANPGSVVTVTGCAIGVGETSDQGGALRVQGGELIVTDSTFTGPIANSQDGGAIYASNSIVTINDSTFTDLTARRGGAVYTTNSGLTINRAHFEGTSATQSGGAVYVLGEHPSIDTGDASISGASFCDTSADKGGALWVGSNLSVTNSVFARTSAITAGHAIQGDDNVLLDHNTMVSDLTAGFLVDLTADVGTISAYDNAVATSGAGAFANNSTTEGFQSSQQVPSQDRAEPGQPMPPQEGYALFRSAADNHYDLPNSYYDEVNNDGAGTAARRTTQQYSVFRTTDGSDPQPAARTTKGSVRGDGNANPSLASGAVSRVRLDTNLYVDGRDTSA